MILRQPFAQTRKKQKLPIAITRKEVLSHQSPPVDTTLTKSSLPPQTTNPRQTRDCATGSKAGLFCYLRAGGGRRVVGGRGARRGRDVPRCPGCPRLNSMF